MPAAFWGRPAGPAARRGPQGWGVRLGLVGVGLTVPPSPPRDTATRSPPGVESENGKQWAGENENLVTFFPKSYYHLLPPVAPREEILGKVTTLSPAHCFPLSDSTEGEERVAVSRGGEGATAMPLSVARLGRAYFRLKRLKLSPTKLLRERDTHVHRVVDPKGGCTRGGLTDTIHYWRGRLARVSKRMPHPSVTCNL